MSDTDPLVSERRGAVLVLRLNRPEARNALSPGLMADLGEALMVAESDPEVRAVVLTGTGDRAFCAGLDLRSFASGEPMVSDARTETFRRLLRGEVTVPMVGAANASALAGGLEILLGCDLIVVAEGARFGLPEVKRGLFAAGGGTFIGARIPLALALELTLTGDPFDAERAAAIGLVNAVVPADRVVEVALAYAERIAANGPLAVAATKELVRRGVFDPAGAWSRVSELQPVIWATDDAKEGATAFIEKREPRWLGR